MKKCIHRYLYYKSSSIAYIQFRTAQEGEHLISFNEPSNPELLICIYNQHKQLIQQHEDATVIQSLKRENRKGLYPCTICNEFILKLCDIEMIIVFYKITGFTGITQFLEQIGIINEEKE